LIDIMAVKSTVCCMVCGGEEPG